MGRAEVREQRSEVLELMVPVMWLLLVVWVSLVQLELQVDWLVLLGLLVEDLMACCEC